jgi:flagellar motility protein MotE (MotC chaperone)
MTRRIRFFVTILLIAKLLLGGLFYYRWAPWASSARGEAVASEPAAPAAEPVATTDETGTESSAVAELSRLEAQREELKQQAQALAAQKADLEKIRIALDEEIKTLKQLREEIQSEQGKKLQIEQQKLKHLIKVYSAMKPKHAASLIEKMDTRLAIRLFAEMKGEIVGDILSYVKTEKAAEISEGLLQKN